ncbi:MAG: response regulator [Thermoanaerobaculia bacterium]|nr:response regulator [Thermoanaerobaculia bacterium]
MSVLVVEDDADFQVVLERMLEVLGFRDVVMVRGIDPALAELATRSFDLLVTDLRLGATNGLELIDAVRSLAPAMRTVLISAHASARDAEVARGLGAVDVLTKPFTSERLESSLRKAIASATGLWGEVQELSLVDMLQMYHYGRRSVVVVLSGEVEGRIRFDAGELVDAQAGDARGVAALAQLLRMTNGLVRTEVAPAAVDRSIDGDFQSILLDSLRLLDESTRALPAEPDAASLDELLAGLGADSALPRSLELSSFPFARQGEDSMATEKQLQETLQKIQAEVAGFIGASVVDLETGMTLAAHSARADFDLSTASAYNSEMVKQKLKIIKALNLKTTLEDMLLTLGDQIHLIKVITPGTFIYMAADKATTNLAIARAAVMKHIGELA